MSENQDPGSEEKPAWRICAHLLAEPAAYYRRFTGRGSEFVMVCKECSAGIQQDDLDLVWVSDERFKDVAVRGNVAGIQGRPEIRTRDSGLRLLHRGIPSSQASDKLLAATAACTSEGKCWLVLNDRREVYAFEQGLSAGRLVASLDALGVPSDSPLMLIAPAQGDVFLVASMYGTSGVVADVRTGRVTMRLSRGEYYVEHCRFPAAFIEHAGRVLLIHATDWNRLDISDPSDGTLLTTRQPSAYKTGEERPEHYLDYFHCGLSVSSDGRWIAEHGWVWHPVGSIVTWDIHRWLESNPWESEDGPSKRGLWWCDYYWDGPLCWIGDRRLMFWGLGDDDVALVPGVRIFDVESGKELPAPNIPIVWRTVPDEVISNGEKDRARPTSETLIYDEWLISYSRGTEFAVWDVATGEQLLCEEGFFPLAYDRDAKVFLSQQANGIFVLSQLATP